MTGRPRIPLEPAAAALLIAAGGTWPRVRLAVALGVSETIPDRAGKSPMDFTTERDARRWIEECQIGGNPAGFLYEMAGRRR